MTELRTFALRPFLAVALVLVLALSGVGRGWAAAPDPAETGPVIAGILVPICHAGADGSPAPVHPGSHDCCDLCALGAPAMAPDAPDLVVPLRPFHQRAHRVAVRWAPILARPRSPRLSQGPPAA